MKTFLLSLIILAFLNLSSTEVFAQDVPGGSAPIIDSSFRFDLTNYPNPANSLTTISYKVPNEGRIYLQIYNTAGQLMTTLCNENNKAGCHKINYSTSKLLPGIYICKLSFVSNTTAFVSTRRIRVLHN